MIRGYMILAGIKLAPRILFSHMTWVRKFAKHPELTPIEVRYKKVRELIIKIIDALKIDVKANHIDYINNHDGSYLGISNHRHFFDPLFYIYLSEKPVSFVAKKEAFKIPFVVRIMKAIDALSIDRSDLLHQLELFKTVGERLKKNDLSYYIFAEGTRMKNADQIQTLPYKDGSLKPAYWAKKDIIFATSYGTHLMTMKKPKGFKKRNVTFEFHPPIKFIDIKDKTTTQVMPMIEKVSNETLIRLAQENSKRNLK